MNQPIREPQLNHRSKIGQKEYIFLTVESVMRFIRQENQFSVATSPSFLDEKQQEVQHQAIPK